MRKVLIIASFVAVLGEIFAQQEPQFNMYMFDRAALNPAAAGVSGAICGTGIFRDQWIGLKNDSGTVINPRTFGASFDMPVYAIKSGAGLNLRYDVIGAEKNLDIEFQYAYHHVLRNNHMLSFGLALNLLNKSIDYSGLYTHELDPALPLNTEGSGMITDVGLGFHYNIPRKFYAGFSMSNLLGSSGDIGGPEFDLSRHYYLFSGYDFKLITRKRHQYVITPGFLLKATSGAVKLDLNAVVMYDDMFWGGILYRVENAVGLMAGVKFYQFSAGVSWDYTLNSLYFDEGRNSIELFVRYCYPIYPKIRKISGYNTRDL